MPRLITFGDSFTYGHWLEDCAGDDIGDLNPSKFAWPEVLGSMLGLETINRSKPGAANIEILRDILTTKILSDDIVVIGWTFSLRDMIFNKNIFGSDTSLRLSVWHKDLKLIKNWRSVHNDHDLSIRAGLYIHHAYCYLKTKNIKHYHFSSIHGWFEVMPEFIVRPENFIDRLILPNIDKALDNSHPGPLSHKRAAENLYKIINEQ